jgi:hypothetical protein
MEAFREFYVGLVHDKAWSILTLEFKLFALRRPESKERFRKTFEMLKATNDSTLWEQMLGQLTRDQKKDHDMSLIALWPILSGLILESHFEPDILSERALRRLLGRIFEALFPERITAASQQ